MATEPSERELGWAAGFWDGEGCTSVNSNRRSDPPYKTVFLSMPQVDREPLDRFTALLGIGKVYGPYPHGRGRPIHRWKASGLVAAAVMENAIMPALCSSKVAQFERVKAEVRQNKEERDAAKRGV